MPPVKPIAPQSQASNYTTVHNLAFRPRCAPLPTGLNNKHKCPSCGVWGLKGSTCNVCRTPIPGARRVYTPPTPAEAAAARKARGVKQQKQPATRAAPESSTAKHSA